MSVPKSVASTPACLVCSSPTREAWKEAPNSRSAVGKKPRRPPAALLRFVSMSLLKLSVPKSAGSVLESGIGPAAEEELGGAGARRFDGGFAFRAGRARRSEVAVDFGIEPGVLGGVVQQFDFFGQAGVLRAELFGLGFVLRVFLE